MSIKDTFKHLRSLLEAIQGDLPKAEEGNKAACQRVRTTSIKFEKVAKHFRKESVKAEKSGSLKKKKSAPKAAAKSKASAKPKAGAKSKAAKKPGAPKKKSAPKKKATATKRATAKLPKKKK